MSTSSSIGLSRVLILLLLQFYTLISADESSGRVVVNVTQGALLGKERTSSTGSRYFSFQGIPYAKPPLGDLRFKPPQPAEGWTGVRDAGQDGNICPQLEDVSATYQGDEDCLFLNVYTPQLPAMDENSDVVKKAVMVFIHGGSLLSGSGSSTMYGADFIVSEDVLLVTINYRLGALGFATTEDDVIPGNAGLKDQVEALKWVQKNVAKFGGDPDNVTIFGESAGASSVHMLVLSPMAKGLFHRAIVQSGSALNNWAFTTAGRIGTLRFTHALGGASNNSDAVLTHLRTIPAQKLVENVTAALSTDETRVGSTKLPFRPISDSGAGYSNKETVFLPSAPIDIIKSGYFNHVPLIFGVNTLEGMIFLYDISNKTDEVAQLDRDMQALLPEDLYPELDTARSMEAARKMKHFYFGEKAFTQETVLQFAQLRSDTFFVFHTNEAVKEHLQQSAQVGGNPDHVYVYQFAFDGPLGFLKRLFGLDQYPGVCHADELGYLFNISYVQPVAADSAAAMVRQMMVRMWTNFAKTGNPSPAAVTWLPVTPSVMNYLLIDQQPVMKTDLEKSNMEFWNEMYKSAAGHDDVAETATTVSD